MLPGQDCFSAMGIVFSFVRAGTANWPYVSSFFLKVEVLEKSSLTSAQSHLELGLRISD